MSASNQPLELNQSEREQVGTILTRRANEIALYSEAHRERYPQVADKLIMPASVEFALEREIKRLRALAAKINPPEPEPDAEEA